MNTGVSIIICTHNGASRLPDCLRHLNQQVTGGVPWECILVDNASTDATSETALRHWKADAPLRIIQEERLGLAYARETGLKSVTHPFVSYVDDDNWVSPDWVAHVQRIFTEHPEVGLCGGNILAVHESQPPEWFERFQESFAVGTQGDETPSDITQTRGHLWGAGLSLRKEALDKLFSAGFSPLLTGRTGRRMLAGEDSEICYALTLQGWRLWHDPKLTLKHFMPTSRLTWDNLCRMHRGFGASHVVLGLYQMQVCGPERFPYLSLTQQAKRAIKELFRRWRFFIPFQKEGNPELLRYQFYLAFFVFLLRNFFRYQGWRLKIEQLEPPQRPRGVRR